MKPPTLRRTTLERQPAVPHSYDGFLPREK
jgi:hypothetical protein